MWEVTYGLAGGAGLRRRVMGVQSADDSWKVCWSVSQLNLVARRMHRYTLPCKSHLEVTA